MLSVYDEPRDGALGVTSRSLDRIVYVDASAESGDIFVHVNDLTPHCLGGAILVDKATREAFARIDFVAGNIHMLAAPAGSGKTQCVIDLSSQIVTVQYQKVLVLTYNKKASVDGADRTKGAPGICWKTVDSVVWDLYKSELKEEQVVDMKDMKMMQAVSSRVLKRHVSEREVKGFMRKLRVACETGVVEGLRGAAKAVFDAGMRGEWWSYAILRLRALGNPLWTTSLQEYGTIIVDEAQDLNLVMIKLLRKLYADHMLVFVRDSSQKIYTFNHCVDIARHIDEPHTDWTLRLTYRFGQQVCDYIERHGLSQTQTFPAPGVPDTQIHYVPDDYIVPGKHTVIMAGWKNILEMGDKCARAGRKVCIDEEKKKELLSEDPAVISKNAYLFDSIDRERVLSILSRLDGSDDDPDLISLGTVHGAKGLQYGVVRVCQCVFDWKGEDHEERHYVAVTRVMARLYLPARQQNYKRQRTSE